MPKNYHDLNSVVLLFWHGQRNRYFRSYVSHDLLVNIFRDHLLYNVECAADPAAALLQLLTRTGDSFALLKAAVESQKLLPKFLLGRCSLVRNRFDFGH